MVGISAGNARMGRAEEGASESSLDAGTQHAGGSCVPFLHCVHSMWMGEGPQVKFSGCVNSQRLRTGRPPCLLTGNLAPLLQSPINLQLLVSLAKATAYLPLTFHLSSSNEQLSAH